MENNKFDTRQQYIPNDNDFESIITQIIDLSNDGNHTRKLVDKLISLKGQMDVEPTLVYIPKKEVIKEYDNDNIIIYRCKTCIIWKHKGGHVNVVYPTMRTEYKFLTQLLDMKDEYDNLPLDLRNVYDASYFGCSLINTLPIVSYGSEKTFYEAATLVGDFIERVVKEAMDKPLGEETPIQDAEFEIKRNAENELFKDVEE